jgi:hypothetical protein
MLPYLLFKIIQLNSLFIYVLNSAASGQLQSQHDDDVGNNDNNNISGYFLITLSNSSIGLHLLRVGTLNWEVFALLSLRNFPFSCHFWACNLSLQQAEVSKRLT